MQVAALAALLVVGARAPVAAVDEPPPPPPLLEEETEEPRVERNAAPPRRRALDLPEEPPEAAFVVDDAPLGPVETAGVQVLAGMGVVLGALLLGGGAVAVGLWTLGSSACVCLAPALCLGTLGLAGVTPAVMALTQVSLGNWLRQRDKWWLFPMLAAYGGAILGGVLLFGGTIASLFVAAAFSATVWPAWFVFAGVVTVALIALVALPAAVYLVLPESDGNPDDEVILRPRLSPTPARPMLF